MSIIRTPVDFAARDQMLSKLTKSVQHWQKMDNLFKRQLPSALVTRCHAVRINDESVLIVFAYSGAVASRLKLVAQSCLPILANAGFYAQRVQVKVVLPECLQERQNNLFISDAALSAISEGAKHISNQKLANALRVLVKNHIKE